MAEDEQRFIEVGDSIVKRLNSVRPLANVKAVLDVGCGYGRVAHALLRRDDFAGSYVGFDTLARQIAWCRANLTPASGNRYRFIHLDIQNERYNPGGTVEADDVRFPVPDDWATLVILTSVFTHLYPEAVRRYLREVSRALSPDGAAYVTAFMLDDEFLAGEGPVKPEDSLPHRLRGYCRYGNAKDPLHRIAYDHRWLEWVAEDAGLKLEVSQLGTWRRNKEGRGTQDALVLTPLPAPEATTDPAPQDPSAASSGHVA